MYHIIDRKTGEVVDKKKTLKSASRKVDKLDMEYGACRYIHKFIPLQSCTE